MLIVFKCIIYHTYVYLKNIKHITKLKIKARAIKWFKNLKANYSLFQINWTELSVHVSEKYFGRNIQSKIIILTCTLGYKWEWWLYF